MRKIGRSGEDFRTWVFVDNGEVAGTEQSTSVDGNFTIKTPKGEIVSPQYGYYDPRTGMFRQICQTPCHSKTRCADKSCACRNSRNFEPENRGFFVA